MKKLLIPLMLLSLLTAAAVVGGCRSNKDTTLNNENILTAVKNGGSFKLDSDITVNAEQ